MTDNTEEGVVLVPGGTAGFAKMREAQQEELAQIHKRIAAGLPAEERKPVLDSESHMLGIPGPKELPKSKETRVAEILKISSGKERGDLLKGINEGEELLGVPGPKFTRREVTRAEDLLVDVEEKPPVKRRAKKKIAVKKKATRKKRAKKTAAKK